MTRRWIFAAWLLAPSIALAQPACQFGAAWAWLVDAGAVTDNYVLTYDAATGCADWAAGGGGGSPPFTDIATGTNTSATMTVGSGAVVTTSGTGTITATDLGCATAPCVADGDVASTIARDSELPDGVPDCPNAGEIIYDAAGASTTTPSCTAMTVDADGTATLPSAERYCISGDTCLGRAAASRFGFYTTAAGTTRADLEAGNIAIGRTTTPQALLSIEGTNGSYTDGHLALRVGSVSQGPILQLFSHATAPKILFGQYWGGAIAGFAGTSTNATANWVIHQGGDTLQISGAAGKALGTDVINTTIMAFDAGDKTVSIGQGSDLAGIVEILSDSVTVDVPNVSAGGCDDPTELVVTVTGAADGDPCFIGVTDNAADTPRLQFTCYVSAANTVQGRACNVGSSGSNPPASSTYTVVVFSLF